MARVKGHHRRIIGVAIGALVAAVVPAVSVSDAQAAPGDTDQIVFYTPLDTQTVPVTAGKSSPVHILLGAASDVAAIQLRFSTNGGATWTDIPGTVQPTRSGSSVFETTWNTTRTGTVELQARDTVSPDTTATATITLSPSSGTRFTDPTAGMRGPFVRPRRKADGSVVPLGVFRRLDGRLFARASGKTSGSVEPTADDPASDPSVVLPGARLSDPTGTFDLGTQTFREPVDLSRHPGLTLPGRAVIRVSDGVSSDAVEAPLYPQIVTAVRSTTTKLAGSNNVTVTASVSDQYGQPVVGAPVRLSGYVSGSRTPLAQVAVTDAGGAVTFTGPGSGSGPATATGYPTGFYIAYADLNLDGKRGSREPGYESVVGTVSFAAPGKAFYHDNRRIRGAGGVLADSLRGTRAAAARGYRWIDQDGQLSYTSLTNLRGGLGRISHPTHLTWVNAHGAPFNPRWLKKGRFETRAWSRIKRRPGLRNADMTFQQNAAHGLSVEWEVKDVRPFTTSAALNAAFSSLAASARRYYGAAWRSRVQVKVLSNLSGGQAFALKVMQVAHAYGFTTIYLARGNATRTQIPAAAHQYVTYVRGARSGLYAPIPPASQAKPVLLTDPPMPGTK